MFLNLICFKGNKNRQYETISVKVSELHNVMINKCIFLYMIHNTHTPMVYFWSY